MKIRIDFNKEEKKVFENMVAVMNDEDVTDEVEVSEDYEPTVVKLKFGRFEYNEKDNYIDLDMKTGFIKDYLGAIMMFFNKFKEVITTWIVEDDTEEYEDDIVDNLKKEATYAEEAFNDYSEE